MADLARFYDFVAGTIIASQQVDDEFNQLVARSNRLWRNIRGESADTTVTGTTAETVLKTINIPAGMLSTHGDKLLIKHSYSILTAGGNKQIRVRLGLAGAGLTGVLLLDSGAVAGSALDGWGEVELKRAASSTTGRTRRLQIFNNAIVGEGRYADIAGLNFAVSQDLVLTGQLTAGGDTIFARNFDVDFAGLI